MTQIQSRLDRTWQLRHGIVKLVPADCTDILWHNHAQAYLPITQENFWHLTVQIFDVQWPQFLPSDSANIWCPHSQPVPFHSWSMTTRSRNIHIMPKLFQKSFQMTKSYTDHDGITPMKHYYGGTSMGWPDKTYYSRFAQNGCAWSKCLQTLGDERGAFIMAHCDWQNSGEAHRSGNECPLNGLSAWHPCQPAMLQWDIPTAAHPDGNDGNTLVKRSSRNECTLDRSHWTPQLCRSLRGPPKCKRATIRSTRLQHLGNGNGSLFTQQVLAVLQWDTPTAAHPDMAMGKGWQNPGQAHHPGMNACMLIKRGPTQMRTCQSVNTASTVGKWDQTQLGHLNRAHPIIQNHARAKRNITVK